MADKIIISKEERLPTLEILGKEYCYDVSSISKIEKLKVLSRNIDKSDEGVINACKEFITLMFCDNEEPVKKMAEIYEDSMVLWLDCIGQLMPYVEMPRVKSIDERKKQLDQLKKASGKK